MTDGITMRPVGTIDLIELKAISDFYGREFIPYPFYLENARTFATRDEYESYTRRVVEQFEGGSLRIFRDWAGTYTDADIRVECCVHYPGSDRPATRIVAHRTGDRGFFSVQQAEKDAVDVFTLSPYDLGAAVVQSISLSPPGKNQELTLSDFGPPKVVPTAADGLLIRHTAEDSSVSRVPRSRVSAMGTVQSHWRHTRKWGLSRDRPAVVWFEIAADGAYLYDRDYSVARPLPRGTLRQSIDRLIAGDVAVLRELRRKS